jgi:hypothetical protein
MSAIVRFCFERSIAFSRLGIGDRRDDPDDRHDDQQLDEGETTVLAH